MKEELKNIVIAEKPDIHYTARNGETKRLINEDDEKILDSKYDEIIKYMQNSHDQSIKDTEKDELYGTLQEMWKEMTDANTGKLSETSFNLILHKDERDYLLDLLKQKCEYNTDTLFYALELENMLNKLNKDGKDFEGKEDAIEMEMTALDIHYLYLVIKDITVKGLNSKTRTFANIIKRISYASNVYNHYKTKFDELSKAIQMWTASLDKGFKIDENDKVYQLIWGNSDNKPTFLDVEKEEQEPEAKIIEE